MKKFSLGVILALCSMAAGASGVYYFYTKSSVSITGIADWGVTQPNIVYQNAYSVWASTTIGSTGITGDPEFTLANLGCAGAKLCSETVTFSPTLGGDYTAKLSATSTAAYRIYPNSTSKVIFSHVVGANYRAVPAISQLTLNAPTNPIGTVDFTVTSTGEIPLNITGITLYDSLYTGGATLIANDCPAALAPGVSCTLRLQFDARAEGSDIAPPYTTTIGVSVLGNTRRQLPAASVKVYVTL